MEDSKNVLQQDVASKFLLKDPKRNPVIRIIDYDYETNQPILDDAGETVTYPANMVTWEIDTPKVTDIYLVMPEYEPSIVFDIIPGRMTGTNKWKGFTKRQDPVNPVLEKYTIIYKRRDAMGNLDDRLYIYDPIIQVNPEPPLSR